MITGFYQISLLSILRRKGRNFDVCKQMEELNDEISAILLKIEK